MNLTQLCAVEIDGVTNVVDTNVLCYTCPVNKQIIVSSLNISSENTDNAQVWLWNVLTGSSVSNANRILAGDLVAGTGGAGGTGGRINAQIGLCMQAGDTIYLKSTKTNVNLIMYGDIYDK